MSRQKSYQFMRFSFYFFLFFLFALVIFLIQVNNIDLIDSSSVEKYYTKLKLSEYFKHNIPTRFRSNYIENVPNSKEEPNLDVYATKDLQQANFLPPSRSKYAYITLISGIKSDLKYRGFLYNALIMKKSLTDLGSKADFIAMIGYSESNTSKFQNDIDLLRSNDIIVYELPRLLDPSHSLSFAEMALLKITPFSFIQYERIQFFDGDIMPLKNMDCFFLLDYNTFTVGAVSPLNSGWFVGIPNIDDYNYMKQKAQWRLSRDWDEVEGWGEKMPSAMAFRGGRPCTKWQFNGADMDQGLFTHRFIVNKGNSILIDTDLRTSKVFKQGIKHEMFKTVGLSEAIPQCHGIIPTKFFAHFTGTSKPWVVNFKKLKRIRKGSPLQLWLDRLDSLQLPGVNSKTIQKMNFKSPLGYFNANFPKGGYKS